MGHPPIIVSHVSNARHGAPALVTYFKSGPPARYDEGQDSEAQIIAALKQLEARRGAPALVGWVRMWATRRVESMVLTGTAEEQDVTVGVFQFKASQTVVSILKRLGKSDTARCEFGR